MTSFLAKNSSLQEAYANGSSWIKFLIETKKKHPHSRRMKSLRSHLCPAMGVDLDTPEFVLNDLLIEHGFNDLAEVLFA